MKISEMPKTSGLILQLVEEKGLPIGCMELWADGDFELITVDVKGIGPEYMWEIIIIIIITAIGLSPGGRYLQSSK
jgi:hypothetical protein